MSYALNAMPQSRPAVSPLMLSDRLLSLAEAADLAGMRGVGRHLLDLALSVLDHPHGETGAAMRRRTPRGRRV